MAIDNNTAIALAAAPAAADSGKAKSGSWFQAMAEAWGKTLDAQAGSIEDLSARVSNGEDTPSNLSNMSVETLRFGYLTTASHTAITSAGEGLKSMASKS